MNATEAILQVLKEQHVTQIELAKRLNLTRASINVALRHADMRTSSLIKYLDALGYDLVYVPKGRALPKDSIKIEKD